MICNDTHKIIQIPIYLPVCLSLYIHANFLIIKKICYTLAHLSPHFGLNKLLRFFHLPGQDFQALSCFFKNTLAFLIVSLFHINYGFSWLSKSLQNYCSDYHWNNIECIEWKENKHLYFIASSHPQTRYLYLSVPLVYF